jgi:pyridoxamine 5'-phosphate oxidase
MDDRQRARLAALRHDYASAGLDESELAADPVEQFRRWFAEGLAAGLAEPNAMVLATADRTGRPSVRTVLLKDYDERGFVFYTNYRSAKAADLADNPRAAGLFLWVELGRQVRIAGPVERVAQRESAAYFASRPREARLGAWASPQSAVLADRGELHHRLAEVTERFAGREVPLPPFWGGYRLGPQTVEFWQGREHRLHDRLRYRRSTGGWAVERLAP